MPDAVTVAWEGAEALRPMLVPIEALEPFPGNPRRGNVATVSGSLGRFGQLKPIVVDGNRIVAGHHVVQAAQEQGWTHVAAVPNEFPDEDEQRAFLLADNRSSDLGVYDPELLVENLRALAEVDALDGTGYSTDDLDAQLAELRKLADDTTLVTFRARKDPDGMTELVLLFSPEQRAEVEEWLARAAAEKGTSGPSETIYAVLRDLTA